MIYIVYTQHLQCQMSQWLHYQTLQVSMDLMVTRLARLLFFGLPQGALYCFHFHRNVWNNVYIYIYVNNMADAKSVHNLSAIFR